MVAAQNHGDKKAPVVLELEAGLHRFGVAVALFLDRNREITATQCPKKSKRLALKMAIECS